MSNPMWLRTCFDDAAALIDDPFRPAIGSSCDHLIRKSILLQELVPTTHCSGSLQHLQGVVLSTPAQEQLVMQVLFPDVSSPCRMTLGVRFSQQLQEVEGDYVLKSLRLFCLALQQSHQPPTARSYACGHLYFDLLSQRESSGEEVVAPMAAEECRLARLHCFVACCEGRP